MSIFVTQEKTHKVLKCLSQKRTLARTAVDAGSLSVADDARHNDSLASRRWWCIVYVSRSVGARGVNSTC